MKQHADISGLRRWVVKIGSALITDSGRGLDRECLREWVDQIADLIEGGHQIVLVSSGAVAEGMQRMGWSQRPDALHDLQAAAAIGQMGLVQAWESCFQRRGLHTAQVLLTHDDLADKQRYQNARATLRTLVGLGVVPIINENDTVANEELRFGDNDSLAALVTNLLEAELMVLLTDQKGLYTADPRQDPDASLVQTAQVNAPELDGMASSEGGSLGRGGMYTKLRAARLAGCSGAVTVITSGKENHILQRLAQGERLGTLLLSKQQSKAIHKCWLAGQFKINGRLILHDNTVQALRRSEQNLLATDVFAVEGDFKRGELVVCVDRQGTEIARGLTNYASNEIAALAEEELVCQDDNLVLI